MDHGGTVWRLKIDEELGVEETRDADLPSESRSAAVEASYRQAHRSQLSTIEKANWNDSTWRVNLADLPKADFRELAKFAPPESPAPPLPSAYLQYVERSPSDLDKVPLASFSARLAWVGRASGCRRWSTTWTRRTTRGCRR